MKPFTTLIAMTFLVMICHQCHGQNQSLSGWANAILLGGGNSGAAQGLLGGLLGGNNGGAAQGLLGGLPNLIPGAGGNTGQAAPTDLLSRINQKSKETIDRTTSWAQQKKQEMTAKMFSGALDKLKPNSAQGLQGLQSNGLLQGAAGALDWLKPKNNLQQPSLRY